MTSAQSCGACDTFGVLQDSRAGGAVLGALGQSLLRGSSVGGSQVLVGFFWLVSPSSGSLCVLVSQGDHPSRPPRVPLQTLSDMALRATPARFLSFPRVEALVLPEREGACV